MRLYITITGIVFLLVTAAHFVRVYLEPSVSRDPFFLASTVISTALAVWALRILRKEKRTGVV